jgi:Lsr2
MVQRTTVVVTDDLDGSEGADTVTFAFEGVEYEVDLSKSNAKKLKKALTPYISAARRTGGRRSTGRRTPASPKRSSSPDTAAIREWARSQGLQVSERGRVPQSVRDQYAAANA